MKKINLLLLSLLIFSLSSCANNNTMKKKTKNINIERYLGKWYEIARYDHKFEKGLTGVTANYSMKPNGKIKVINSGYAGNLNGEYKSVEGKAYIPNPDNSGHIKVSFFWIFYADYFVLDIDEKDYNWAIVGSKSNNYLWILCRNPKISDDLYNELIRKIENLGYNSSKLIKVEHK